MKNSEFFAALNSLEAERKISKEVFIESLEAGLASAYKKEWGETRMVVVRVNEEKQTIKVYVYRQIVEEVEDPAKEVSLEEARDVKPNCKLGEVLIEDITPKEFSRIAAQTAKQVIMQRINDARRDMIMNEMNEKEGEIMAAVVRRKEGNNVFVEMSTSQMEGIMMQSDQIFGENYNVGETIKVYVKKVRTNMRGSAQVVVSRSSAGFVKRLFEMEVPEIRSNLVSIRGIVREAGQRTKIAVCAEDPNVDAIGSCIGNKGVRINAILAELNGEKIDVIEWDDDPAVFISRALSPAKIMLVAVTEDEKSAKVVVADDKLSLAIGKRGQNARLAAKLTGWKIDVKPFSETPEGKAQSEEEASDATDASSAANN